VADVRALAASYGVTIELVDLGSWGSTTLVAEYDPRGPVIRVNARAVATGCSDHTRATIDRAIAHELYHHREALGEIARIGERAARERAADRYADDLVGAN
jgi:hypothetical protein